MSTPNPILQAGAPEIVAILKAAQAMVTTICTGDPGTAALRVAPAVTIFVGTVGLQAPLLGAAELGAVGTAVNGQLGSLITKVQAQATPAAA